MLRRERGSSWYILPDEKMDINWNNVYDCLNHVGRWTEIKENPLFGEIFFTKNYTVKKFQQISSIKYPCCHIADFFAGISVFSINNYHKYLNWLSAMDRQIQMFPIVEQTPLSNSDRYRLMILHQLISLCQENKLGVSIKSKRCLNTPNPSNSINFWHYTPQHELDKAPRRNNNN